MLDSASFIGQVATVALIAIGTRWVINAKGAQFPKTSGETSIYGIKWPWRAVGFVSGAFWVVILVWSRHDLRHLDVKLILVPAVFVIGGLWLGIGSVSTDEVGITKRFLWKERSFRWNDISEIRFHKKKGAIELRAGSKKLVIDYRIVAFEHLLREIEERTQVQSVYD